MIKENFQFPILKSNLHPGFTLIELLVVVSIITVISAVGLVSFQTVRNNALEAKRKGDIDAIKKAYESNYDPTANGGQGGYRPLSPTQFSDNKVPAAPDGSSYVVAVATPYPDATLPNFTVCADTQTGASCMGGSSCYCASSNQGQPLPPKGTDGAGGVCDPTGILRTNLVSYWNMNEPQQWTGTGYEIRDIIGNYNGRAIDGAVNSSTGNPNGNFGKTAVFSGTGSFIYIPHSSALNPQKMTLSFWINVTNYAGSYPRLARKWNAYDLHMYTYQGGEGGLEWDIRIPGETDTQSTINLALNTWYHVVVSYDGSAGRIYINNQSRGQNTRSGNISSSSSGLEIGSAYFKGKIDDVRIYNQGLSENVIRLLYNDGKGCF